MTKPIIHIVAGGPRNLIPDLSLFIDHPVLWAGVDHGVRTIFQAGIAPHVAVGDFDSISTEEWQQIEKKVPAIHKFRPEKDETDMELALLWAVGQTPEKIVIFGATGGRLDHFMANAFLAAAYKQKYPDIMFELIDTNNTISVWLPGMHTIEQDPAKKYVSFIPVFNEVIGLTLSGFKYPLRNHTVPLGSSLCVSNELIRQTGHFSFEKGILMMIRSMD
ncbi:thiamine diphosphokinase [Bacillus sp. VT-16-64]|nr:thiamine diphosphokinase [Bacillus sp. VT-16-64]